MKKNKKDLRLFEKILTIPSVSHEEYRMFHFIENFLVKEKINYEVKEGNIIATKRNKDGFLPGICCHMDTVHKIKKNPLPVEKFKKDGSWIYTSKYGIGGDDKCGIFICLSMLKKFGNIKAFFFSNEEVGMQGSYSLDLEEFKDISYLIEADRKGNSDIITQHFGESLISENFYNYIENIRKKYGYEHTEGIGTDVSSLVEKGLNLSVINVSCGFYNPHTLQEYIILKDVYKAMDFIEDVIKKPNNKQFKNKFQGTNYRENFFYENFDYCIICQREIDIDGKYFKSKYGLVCQDCLDRLIDNYFNN